MDADLLDLSLAIKHHKAGHVDRASAIYRRLLEIDPRHAGALHLLGVISQQEGRFEDAARLIANAVVLVPDRATYRSNLGLAYMALGRLNDALDTLENAVRLRSEYADALSNLGVVLHRLGRVDDARSRFDQALASDPTHNDARFNLANLLRDMGELPRAAALYQAVLGVAPERIDVRNNLGNVLLELGQTDGAITAYREVLGRNPGFVDALANLGVALMRDGREEEAADHFASVSQANPEDPTWRIRTAGLCPTVFPNTAALDHYRDRLESVLDTYQGLGIPWDDEVRATECTPSFALAHHGRDERRIREKYAVLYRTPALRPVRTRESGLPRLGFVVTHPNEPVFLRCMGGILRHLTPGRFAVTVFGSNRGIEWVRREINRPDFAYLGFPADRVAVIAERIRIEQCDLLYHWEVGTDAVNYLLPFARPAPIQCTSWGIQATTGHPAIDIYVSSAMVESEEADAHYSERLMRLPSLLSYYSRISLPCPPARRSEFGLPEEVALYLCLQRPLKLHPEFDLLLADILRRDLRGRIVLLSGPSARIATALRERFRRTMPDVADRVLLLAVMPPDRYYRLLSLADVVLDPRPYGAGSSCYDVFSYNLPLVTWPTTYNAGRYALACYRRMNLDDLITKSREEYAVLAARLGSDPDFRTHIVNRIANRSDVLFDDVSVVQSHEQFLESSIREARLGILEG